MLRHYLTRLAFVDCHSAAGQAALHRMARAILHEVHALPASVLDPLQQTSLMNNVHYLQTLVERLGADHSAQHVTDCEQALITLQFVLRTVLRAH